MKVFFGDRLRELRGNLSQAEMSSKLHTKQSTYSAWERNQREPDITTICAIASAFSVTTDWLLGVSKTRYPQHQESAALLTAESPADPYTVSSCRGCAERDARIDKLLDILHRGSPSSPAPYHKEVSAHEGRVLPAGAEASGR